MTNDTLNNTNTRLLFTKMHGLGNDFMVLDLVSQDVRLSPEQIRALGHRRTGVGFDQLLTLEAPTDPDCDFRYRIYNADGEEVEHCGNGARCVSRFLVDRGLTHKHELKLQLAEGHLLTRLLDDGQVTVDMGPPILAPDRIPFQAEQEALRYDLLVGQSQLSISAVSMGNPHAVLQVDNVDTAPVAELGPQIEHHPRFPRRVNAGFMQVVDRSHIRLRVFERGAGETLACGTGACAAVVAGRRLDLLDSRVSVELNGGTLCIEWAGADKPVMMTGPATTVYDGILTL